MLLFGFALLALIAGTTLRKVGVEAARANAYGSAAALAGRGRAASATGSISRAAQPVVAILWIWL